MRIYKVSMHGDFGAYESWAMWTSKKSAIPGMKRELKEMCHDRESRAEPTVEELDIPTNRDGIIAFLNEHASRGGA